MKHRLLIFALALAAQVARAGSPVPPVIKIVYRNMAADIPADSFGAKPKTIYICDEAFSRVEEEPDPEQHIHGLIIISEPDVWMINLLAGRGQHIVDPGPTFVTHFHILGVGAPKEFSTLEFGKEAEFFKNHHAKPVAAKAIDGQLCDGSEYELSPYRLVFYVRQDTHAPFQLDVFKDDKPQFSVRYLSYETTIPFDAALFRPPPGIAISEAKAKSR